MSITSKIHVLKSLEYDHVVKHGLGYKKQDCISGIFSTFTHSWLAYGPQLFIINHSDGTTRCSWMFGEYCHEQVEITCAIELPLEGCTIPILIVGVSSENVNQISFFNPNTRKIIRTIDLIYPVRTMCIVEHGLHEVNPINDTLTNTQGLIAAGCADGSLLLLDLCRGILLKALSCDFRFVTNEEKPVEICCLDLKSVSSSAIQETLQECYDNNNNFAILLTEELKGITALYYSFESAILYFGTSSGSFVLWNMSNLTVLLRSSSIGHAITSLSLLEPCDDPRHNLFLWVSFENHPYVCMYCVTFKSKYYVEGYGVYYQGFEGASQSYKLKLGQEENFVKASAISSQAIAKSVSKNLAKTFSIPEGEVSQLRLFITGFEVLYKGNTTKSIVIFDLNQWYKEQMPDEGVSNCVDIVDLGNSAFLHFNIDPSSLSHYQWMRPLEQHFYPSSLDFKIWCIEEGGIRCLQKLGLQSQWIKNMKAIGPSALLTPTQVFQGALSAGILSMFIEPPDPDFTTIEEARSYILTVCLENRVTSVIEHCAEEWSTGSHPVAGCTLSYLIEWLWQLQATYKSYANRMCVPLFDQSGLGFDFCERQTLQHCKSLLNTVQTVYELIVSKYKSYVLVDGINQKLSAMSLVKFYFDCCLKLINANLLPEPNEAGRPNDSLAYKYDEIREFATARRKNGPFLVDCLIGKTGGENQWEEEGGVACYPPPSIQSVLRYCLHPGPSLRNKYSLLLYLYMDVINSHEPLRCEGNLEKVKNFQYLLRIPDVQYKIVSSFWFLDHSLFDEGISLILDPKVLSMDLTDEQHRNILSLLLLQSQEKLGLQYMRLKAPPLHTASDISLEMSLLLGNRLINEAFMFQRRHPELREELLIQFFQGCIDKKLLGPVFGLHLDPKEESVLFKFLKSCNLKEKGDLQVLLLLSKAKYNEAISLNNRLNSTINGPKARLETDTRDMIVRGITGSLSTISREMASEMRKYRPPPPGTRPVPLSSLIKIQIEPDGPLCQADSRILLSAAAKCSRHLAEFISTGSSKRKNRSFENDEENMDIDIYQPPRKKTGEWIAQNGIRHMILPIGASCSGMFKTTSNKDREVLELIGIPLVKKRGKRFSPLSRPSPSILKGKTAERVFLDEQQETPRKTLRFNLPEKVGVRKSLYPPADDASAGGALPNSGSMREKLKTLKNNMLLSDGSVDWTNIAITTKPGVLFTLGVGGTKSPRASKKTKTFLDITITDAERKYLDSPSRGYDSSPVTEALFLKDDYGSGNPEEEIENEVEEIQNKYRNQESFLDRYKRLRNKKTCVKEDAATKEMETCDDDMHALPINNSLCENDMQTAITEQINDSLNVVVTRNTEENTHSNTMNDFVKNDKNKENRHGETCENLTHDESKNSIHSADPLEDSSTNIKVLEVFTMEEENKDRSTDLLEESPLEISSDDEAVEEPPKDKILDSGEQSEDAVSWEDMSEEDKYSYDEQMADLYEEPEEDNVSSEVLQSEDTDDSFNYNTETWVKKGDEVKKKSSVNTTNDIDTVICLDSDSEDLKDKGCNFNAESNDTNPFDEEDYSQSNSSERSDDDDDDEYMGLKLPSKLVQSESDIEETEVETFSLMTPIKSNNQENSSGKFEKYGSSHVSDVDKDPLAIDSEGNEKESDTENNINKGNDGEGKVNDGNTSADMVKNTEKNEQEVDNSSANIPIKDDDKKTVIKDNELSARTSTEEIGTRECGAADLIDIYSEVDSESSDDQYTPLIEQYNSNVIFDNPIPVPLNVAYKYRQKCEKVQRDISVESEIEKKLKTNEAVSDDVSNPFEIDTRETMQLDDYAEREERYLLRLIAERDSNRSKQAEKCCVKGTSIDKSVTFDLVKEDKVQSTGMDVQKSKEENTENATNIISSNDIPVEVSNPVTFDLVKEGIVESIDMAVLESKEKNSDSATNIISSNDTRVGVSNPVSFDLVKEGIVESIDMAVLESKEENSESATNIISSNEEYIKVPEPVTFDLVAEDLIKLTNMDALKPKRESSESIDNISSNEKCIEVSKPVTCNLVRENLVESLNMDVLESKEKCTESDTNIVSSNEKCVDVSKPVTFDLISENSVQSSDIDALEQKTESSENIANVSSNEKCVEFSEPVTFDLVKKDVVESINMDVVESKEENVSNISSNEKYIETSKPVTFDLVKEDVVQSTDMDVLEENVSNISSNDTCIEVSKPFTLDLIPEGSVKSIDVDVLEPKRESSVNVENTSSIEISIEASKPCTFDLVNEDIVESINMDVSDSKEENVSNISSNENCVEVSKPVTFDLVTEDLVKSTDMDVLESKEENVSNISSNENCVEVSKPVTFDLVEEEVVEPIDTAVLESKEENSDSATDIISSNENCVEVSKPVTFDLVEEEVVEPIDTAVLESKEENSESATDIISSNEKCIEISKPITFDLVKKDTVQSIDINIQVSKEENSESASNIINSNEKSIEVSKPDTFDLVKENIVDSINMVVLEPKETNPESVCNIISSREINIKDSKFIMEEKSLGNIEVPESNTLEESQNDISDPGNTGMLNIDLSLCLSEDELNAEENKTNKLDKSVITTDSYLLRKARRSSRNVECDNQEKNKTIAGPSTNYQGINKETRMQQDKVDNTNVKSSKGQISDKSYFDIKKDSKSNKRQVKTRRASTATQTSENPISKRSDDKINLEDSSIRKSPTRGKKQRSVSSSSQTSEDLQVIKERSECLSQKGSELKGILKNKLEVFQDNEEKSNPSPVLDERIRLSTHLKDAHDMPKNVNEKRSRRSSVCSQSSEGTKNLHKKDDTKLFGEESNEKGIRGILKKSSTRESIDDFGDEREHLSQKKVGRRSSSRSSVVGHVSEGIPQIQTDKKTRKSQEPVIRGILKNRRSSVTSETGNDLRKRLEEDFPGERKHSRRSYSEEPEFLNICKRTSECSDSKSRRHLLSSKSADELQSRFEDHYRENQRSKRKQLVEGEVYDSQRDSISSAERHNEKRPSSRKLSEDGDLPRTQKRTDRRSTQLPEKSDLTEYSYSRKTRRQSVHSENYSKLDEVPQQGKSRRHSQASEDLVVESRGNTRRPSVDPENHSNLDKRAHGGKSQRHSKTSDDTECDLKASNEDISENRVRSRKSLLLSRYKEDYGCKDQQTIEQSSVGSEDSSCIRNAMQDFVDSHSSEPGYSKSKTRQRRSSAADIFENVQPKKRRISQSSGVTSLTEEPIMVEVPRRSMRKSLSCESLENSSNYNPPEESGKGKHVNNPLHMYNIEEESPKVKRKSLSLNDIPVRKSIRLIRPALEDIKEEDEHTPRKKRSLDDLDAINIKLKANKKNEPKTFLPMIIDESDSDGNTHSPIWPIEEYVKERRLTRTQKKMLLKNQPIREEATPSPSSTPKKVPRKLAPPVTDSPTLTPTRSSLRLQKKPPSETD